MTREFIIYEDSVHAQVFLVQAESEEQAWTLYLDREYDYIKQPDGTYRGRPEEYDNLDKIFGAYGLMLHPDGTYTNTHGLTFAALEEVKSHYGIEEQADETFNVYDVSYPSLMEAVHGEVGHHHVEIDPCNINMLAAFQTLFVSKDKWDYVELDTPEDLRSDIISQHLWQAERYTTLGQLKEAVAELKKALRLTTDPRNKNDLHGHIARLLWSRGQLSAAAKQYKIALHTATEFDNFDMIRYYLAQVYEEMGQPAKALWHYKRVDVDELHDDTLEELKKRVAELEERDKEFSRKP